MENIDTDFPIIDESLYKCDVCGIDLIDPNDRYHFLCKDHRMNCIRCNAIIPTDNVSGLCTHCYSNEC